MVAQKDDLEAVDLAFSMDEKWADKTALYLVLMSVEKTTVM